MAVDLLKEHQKAVERKAAEEAALKAVEEDSKSYRATFQVNTGEICITIFILLYTLQLFLF